MANTGPSTKYIAKDGLIRRRSDGALVRRIGSDGWYDWLQSPTIKSFHYLGDSGQHATICKEKRTGAGGDQYYYFIAYRSIAGKKKRVYLGRAEKVSLLALEKAAGKLAQLALKAESGPAQPSPVLDIA